MVSLNTLKKNNRTSDYRIQKYCIMILIYTMIGFHTYFNQNVSYILNYVKIIGKIFFVYYLLSLNIYIIKKYKVNSKSIIYFIPSLIIITLCCHNVIVNNIKTGITIAQLIFLINIIFLFYCVVFSEKKLELHLDFNFNKKGANKLLLYLSIVVLFLFLFDIAVKYYIDFRHIHKYLYDNNLIRFYWRLTGFLGDPNRWAIILNSIIIIAFSLYNQWFESYNKYFRYFIALLIVYVVFTMSISGILILILILLLINYKKKFFSFKMLFTMVLIISVIYIIFNSELIIKNQYLLNRINHRINDLLNPLHAPTFKNRLNTYKNAIDIFNDNIFTGIGYMNSGINRGYTLRATMTHNTLLTLMAFFGIFGIIVFFQFFILPFFFVYKRTSDKNFLLIYFVSYFISINFLTVTHDLINIIFYYLFLMIFVVKKRFFILT